MQELSEVFTGPEELEFAKKILSAVPDDIGESPFADACLSGIVLKAYINETSKITGPLAEVNAFIAEKETYCRDHNILEKLKNAGHIESGGCAGNDTLYIKARQH